MRKNRRPVKGQTSLEGAREKGRDVSLEIDDCNHDVGDITNIYPKGKE